MFLTKKTLLNDFFKGILDSFLFEIIDKVLNHINS